MDPSGAKDPFDPSPLLRRCLNRHKKDYVRLSATPDRFQTFFEDVGLMQRTQPNYSRAQLGAIGIRVAVLHSERDEFIKQEHAEYLAKSIPRARFQLLYGVSHFAPLQRPGLFNSALLAFLRGG
jgi:pimeloyl-ACP methyl ester carboxylesterase